ncbi:putative F-box protein PP2-B2 [Henckelia pumila]|uniref:putative F-box protein PP2-B2 n=1 Tax=Henckelia pumila TaxID=405737 RepID=UPI003C6E7C31
MAVASCRDINDLPADCITYVFSLTTPKDAVRLSVVNSTFRSHADSDAVWMRFLPSEDIISGSTVRSKKDFYIRLSNFPILVDSGCKSFQLEKWSGKKIYMLIAGSGLTIPAWGVTRYQEIPRYMEGIATRIHRQWKVRGYINTKTLTSETNYAAYLVFRNRFLLPASDDINVPLEAYIGIKGSRVKKRSVFLNAPQEPRATEVIPKRRMDWWMEVELGEYFVKGAAGEDEILLIFLSEVQGLSWWLKRQTLGINTSPQHHFIIQGIEIRPKEST